MDHPVSVAVLIDGSKELVAVVLQFLDVVRFVLDKERLAPHLEEVRFIFIEWRGGACWVKISFALSVLR